MDVTPWRVYGLPNAAPEWQARSFGWRSEEVMAACALEGLVGRHLVESKISFSLMVKYFHQIISCNDGWP